MAIDRERRMRPVRPKHDPRHREAAKRTKQAVEHLKELGVMDSQGRRVRQDLPADMREGAERDFGG